MKILIDMELLIEYKKILLNLYVFKYVINVFHYGHT